MARRRIGAKPLSAPMITYCHLDPNEQIWIKSKFKYDMVFIQEHVFENVMAVICLSLNMLTHWGRVTHVCVGKQGINGSDNGLSPGRCQAIIWTNAGILLFGPLGTNFSEISIKILTFSFTKCVWKCRLRNGVHLNMLTHFSLDEDDIDHADGNFKCLLLDENI